MTGMIIGSTIGAGASLIGSSQQASAVNKASRRAAEVQRYMYDMTRADQAPYREAGYGGLDALQYLMGLKQAPVKPDRADYTGDADLAAAQQDYQNALGNWERQQQANVNAEYGVGVSTGIPVAPLGPPPVAPDPADYQGEADYNAAMEDYAQQKALYDQFGGQGEQGPLPEFQYNGQGPIWQGTHAPTLNQFNPNAPLPGAPELSTLADSRVQQWGGFDPNQLANDPGYQFRLNEGMKAIEGSAAAKGMLASGKTLKDIAQYSQGLASDEFARARGRAVEDYSLNRGAGSEQFQRDQYGNVIRQQGFGNQMGLSDTTFNRATQATGLQNAITAQQYALQNQAALQNYQMGTAEEQRAYQRGVGQYGMDYQRAQDVYGRSGDQFNRMATLAGLGQTSLQQTGQAGMNMANQTAAIQQNLGAQQASIYGNLANTIGQTAESMAMVPYFDRMMQSRFPIAGGGGQGASGGGGLQAMPQVSPQYYNYNNWGM